MFVLFTSPILTTWAEDYKSDVDYLGTKRELRSTTAKALAAPSIEPRSGARKAATPTTGLLGPMGDC